MKTLGAKQWCNLCTGISQDLALGCWNLDLNNIQGPHLIHIQPWDAMYVQQLCLFISQQHVLCRKRCQRCLTQIEEKGAEKERKLQNCQLPLLIDDAPCLLFICLSEAWVPGAAVIAGKPRAASSSSSGRTQHHSCAKDVISPACPGSALGSSPCWTCLKHLPREALLWYSERVLEPPQTDFPDVE